MRPAIELPVVAGVKNYFLFFSALGIQPGFSKDQIGLENANIPYFYACSALQKTSDQMPGTIRIQGTGSFAAIQCVEAPLALWFLLEL